VLLHLVGRIDFKFPLDSSLVASGPPKYPSSSPLLSSYFTLLLFFLSLLFLFLCPPPLNPPPQGPAPPG
jgi:hypothetical protein